MKLADEEMTALRYRVEAGIAGTRFSTFTLDVGSRGVVAGDSSFLETRNLLEFAGVSPIVVSAISLEQHLAEKLHAYSRMYAHDRPSSRVKNLVDMVLIVSEYDFEIGPLRAEIEKTFSRRSMQELPDDLSAPPDFWKIPYQQMASEIGL